MKYSKARGSSSGIIEMFFCLPKTSQKARRINFTSSSETYCRTSFAEYFMISSRFSSICHIQLFVWILTVRSYD